MQWSLFHCDSFYSFYVTWNQIVSSLFWGHPVQNSSSSDKYFACLSVCVTLQDTVDRFRSRMRTSKTTWKQWAAWKWHQNGVAYPYMYIEIINIYNLYVDGHNTPFSRRLWRPRPRSKSVYNWTVYNWRANLSRNTRKAVSRVSYDANTTNLLTSSIFFPFHAKQWRQINTDHSQLLKTVFLFSWIRNLSLISKTKSWFFVLPKKLKFFCLSTNFFGSTLLV
jgi:hypothetical protein